MSLTNKLSLFALGAVALSSLVSASVVDTLGKRSILSERQACETPGWIPACPGLFACVPPGAICCSDGFTYVMPPRSCPGGTDPVATAVTGIESTTTPPPPPPVSTIVDYVWYTYTYTWYYWYYYYIYIDITSTKLVSTQYTSVTTISYSATDEAAASAYFTGYTATAVFPTPTQTATPISGSIPPSYPTATSSISSVVIPSYNATVTTAVPTSSSIVTAGASKTGPAGGWVVSPMFGAAVLGLLSGFAMMVL